MLDTFLLKPKNLLPVIGLSFLLHSVPTKAMKAIEAPPAIPVLLDSVPNPPINPFLYKPKPLPVVQKKNEKIIIKPMSVSDLEKILKGSIASDSLDTEQTYPSIDTLNDMLVRAYFTKKSEWSQEKSIAVDPEDYATIKDQFSRHFVFTKIELPGEEIMTELCFHNGDQGECFYFKADTFPFAKINTHQIHIPTFIEHQLALLIAKNLLEEKRKQKK